MPVTKYIVDLTEEEREQLLQLIRKGNSAARKLARARILRKAAEGLSDAQIAKVLDLGTATVGRVRKRFVEEGLESALQERPRLGQRLKLDGQQQAHLLAVACTNPPQGHARWTLRLLAGRVVELGWAESISPETVRQVLKKQTSSPGRKSSGAFLR